MRGGVWEWEKEGRWEGEVGRGQTVKGRGGGVERREMKVRVVGVMIYYKSWRGEDRYK